MLESEVQSNCQGHFWGFFLAMPCGIWDLSFETKDEPRLTSVKAPSPNHRTARVFHQELEIRG